MSELTDKLRSAGEQHKGTELGGLMQWAALHIESQDDALADARQEHEDEERERLRLERALHKAKSIMEDAIAAIAAPLCPPIELGRDMVPHINLMAGHGDPDYLKSNGNSIRHVDCRAPRSKKTRGQSQENKK